MGTCNESDEKKDLKKKKKIMEKMNGKNNVDISKMDMNHSIKENNSNEINGNLNKTNVNKYNEENIGIKKGNISK